MKLARFERLKNQVTWQMRELTGHVPLVPQSSLFLINGVYLVKVVYRLQRENLGGVEFGIFVVCRNQRWAN